MEVDLTSQLFSFLCIDFKTALLPLFQSREKVLTYNLAPWLSLDALHHIPVISRNYAHEHLKCWETPRAAIFLSTNITSCDGKVNCHCRKVNCPWGSIQLQKKLGPISILSQCSISALDIASAHSAGRSPSDLNGGGQRRQEPGRIGAGGEWEAGGRVLRGWISQIWIMFCNREG